MEIVFNLGSAPNTANPCMFVLRKKGYDLEVKNVQDRYCLYIATREGRRFVGHSGPEVLGLVTMWEHLGDNWMEHIAQIPDIVAEVISEEPED